MRKGQGLINAYDFLDQHYFKLKNKMINSKTGETDKMSKQKTCNSTQNMSQFQPNTERRNTQPTKTNALNKKNSAASPVKMNSQTKLYQKDQNIPRTPLPLKKMNSKNENDHSDLKLNKSQMINTSRRVNVEKPPARVKIPTGPNAIKTNRNTVNAKKA